MYYIGLNEFNDRYVSKLLDNVSNEKKTFFLLAEFNIDLSKYDSNTPTNGILVKFEALRNYYSLR